MFCPPGTSSGGGVNCPPGHYLGGGQLSPLTETVRHAAVQSARVFCVRLRVLVTLAKRTIITVIVTVARKRRERTRARKNVRFRLFFFFFFLSSSLRSELKVYAPYHARPFCDFRSVFATLAVIPRDTPRPSSSYSRRTVLDTTRVSASACARVVRGASVYYTRARAR